MTLQLKHIPVLVSLVSAISLFACGSGTNGSEGTVGSAKQALSCTDDSECYPYACGGTECFTLCGIGHAVCADGATCNESNECIGDPLYPCEYYKIKDVGHGQEIDCYDSCTDDSNCIEAGHCDNGACVAD